MIYPFRRVILLLVLLQPLLFQCGNKAKQEKIEAANFVELPPLSPSTISIPLTIEMSDLQALINQQLADMNFASGTSTEDSRLKVKIKKAADIAIDLFSEQIRYQVPLELDIAYDLTLGTAKADGVLLLDFISVFNIDPAWNLRTQTRLVSHRWQREPQLRLGVVSLPLSSVSNFAIRRSQAMIEQGIDEAVAEQGQLGGYITNVWNELQKPILVAEDYQAWLRIQPQDLRMTPLSTTATSLSAIITLEALPKLAFSQTAPYAPASPFPSFKYVPQQRAENDFVVNIASLVTYEEAQRLAAASVVNQTFSSGNKSVTINDLKLFPSGDKVMITLAASGAYNGNIYLSGIPYYDNARKKLQIQNLDFTLQTKSLLTKTAAWLFKSMLKNQIENNLDEMLSTNMQEMQTEIDAQLADQDLGSGVRLKGKLNQFDLGQVYLRPEGLEVRVAISGRLDIDLDNLLKTEK